MRLRVSCARMKIGSVLSDHMASYILQRSWLSSSRQYLFRNVSLTPSNVDEFLEFLIAPSCILASYVRLLHINKDYEQFLEKLMSCAQPLCTVKSLDWDGTISPARRRIVYFLSSRTSRICVSLKPVFVHSIITFMLSHLTLTLND
jgi:hypothetical protein